MYQEGLFLFNDLSSFSKAVETETDTVLDFAQVLQLNSDFIQASGEYLVVNVKGLDAKEPNNLLFLTKDKAFLYSGSYPRQEDLRAYDEVFRKPFGRSTILCFLTLDKALTTYSQRVEIMIPEMKQLDEDFNHSKYRDMALEFERMIDKLEEFHELLLKLQERRYTQVETQHISFDYSVLLAESIALQNRCRRRLSSLKEMRQNYEMMATEELNQRIVKLNDVVKKLTAITVILMLPTLIASHFGMNFEFMPELKVPWAYPVIIILQVAIMGIGYAVFRKIGWL